MIVGYCYVVADLLHIGHLKHLQACAGLCDKLVVGVLTDGATMEKKPKPIISFGERLEIIKHVRYVDVTVKQITYAPHDNIRQLHPDIVFESTSHAEELIKETTRVAEDVDARIIVMPYFDGQSSTRIKEKILKCFKSNES